MNLYNMLNGVNIGAFLIFPMLGYGHPEDGGFPRFRDCFVEDGNIQVYSRMGGGNRECWEDNKEGEKCTCWACQAEEIENSDLCLSRIDDDWDSTYCTFTFKVPEKWKMDFDLVLAGKITETSEEYKKMIIGTVKKRKTKTWMKKLLYGEEKK